MAKKQDVLEIKGSIEEVLPGGKFRVKLENEHEIIAYIGGKMRKFQIKLGIGDMVRVELTPYDLTKGRITYRV
jgi:translation initiation factor IF-1